MPPTGKLARSKGKRSAKKSKRQELSSSDQKGSAIKLPPSTGIQGSTTFNAIVDAGGSSGMPSTSSGDTLTQKILELPTKLSRPHYVPIPQESLTAVDPGFSTMPAEYILDYVLLEGEKMYTIAKNIAIETPGSATPRSGVIELSLQGITHIPTHVLAVTARKPTSKKLHAKLYVVHSLVLAANCAKLPHLPYVDGPTPDAQNIRLPIVSVYLPSPETFGIILQFLYTHNMKDLCLSLLPTTEYDLSQADLSKKLVEMCTFRSLLSLLSTVYELWANVLVLGIFDDDLWDTLDRVWEAFIGALATRPEKIGTRDDSRETMILLRVQPQEVENIDCFIALTKPWPQT